MGRHSVGFQRTFTSPTPYPDHAIGQTMKKRWEHFSGSPSQEGLLLLQISWSVNRVMKHDLRINDAAVGDAVLNELDHPRFVEIIDEALDVGIK